MWANCLLAVTLARNVYAQAPTPPDEYRLKAAFVYRFPQFVEWPPAAWKGRESLQLCVSRPNVFGSTLRELVAGELIDGKPITVREVETAGSIDSCHLLFLSSAGRDDKELLTRAATMPILTVGDAPRFLDAGGIINLHIVDRRVRFEINAAAAERVGLRLSSQLLRLASDVRRGEP